MEGLEDVWDVHDRENIIFLGWIHTHPEYDVFLSRCYQCVVHLPTSSSFLFLLFLSSVDMHNQYEWQHMLPEALAIVCRCCNCQDLCSFHECFTLVLSFMSSIKFDKTGFLSLTEAGLQEIGRCDQVSQFYSPLCCLLSNMC